MVEARKHVRDMTQQGEIMSMETMCFTILQIFCGIIVAKRVCLRVSLTTSNSWKILLVHVYIHVFQTLMTSTDGT